MQSANSPAIFHQEPHTGSCMARWLCGGFRRPGWGETGLAFRRPPFGASPDVLRPQLKSWLQSRAASWHALQFGLSPLIQSAPLGLVLVIGVKLTQHIADLTVSTPLGANENSRLTEALPLCLGSQPWEQGAPRRQPGFES